jgi:hypothetical protein
MGIFSFYDFENQKVPKIIIGFTLLFFSIFYICSIAKDLIILKGTLIRGEFVSYDYQPDLFGRETKIFKSQDIEFRVKGISKYYWFNRSRYRQNRNSKYLFRGDIIFFRNHHFFPTEFLEERRKDEIFKDIGLAVLFFVAGIMMLWEFVSRLFIESTHSRLQ